jgi:hypothetical protein
MPKRVCLTPGLLLLLIGCGDNGSGEPGPVLSLNTISAGGNQTCGTNSAGEVLCWGKYSDSDHLVPHDSFLARPVTVTSVNPSTDVVVGSDALRCVIRSGSVACWATSQSTMSFTGWPRNPLPSQDLCPFSPRPSDSAMSESWHRALHGCQSLGPARERCDRG